MKSLTRTGIHYILDLDKVSARNWSEKANNQILSLFITFGTTSSTHVLYSGMPDFGRSKGPIVAKLGRNTIGMKTNPSQSVLEYFGNFSIF